MPNSPLDHSQLLLRQQLIKLLLAAVYLNFTHYSLPLHGHCCILSSLSNPAHACCTGGVCSAATCS